jgi:hypothetical protein
MFVASRLLTESISMAGRVSYEEIETISMLHAISAVCCAGENLNREAPMAATSSQAVSQRDLGLEPQRLSGPRGTSIVALQEALSLKSLGAALTNQPIPECEEPADNHVEPRFVGLRWFGSHRCRG